MRYVRRANKDGAGGREFGETRGRMRTGELQGRHTAASAESVTTVAAARLLLTMTEPAAVSDNEGERAS